MPLSKLTRKQRIYLAIHKPEVYAKFKRHGKRASRKRAKR